LVTSGILISAIDLLQFLTVCDASAAVWSVLEQRVYCTRIRDVSHVKTHLVEEWQKFYQKIIDWEIANQAVASMSEVMHSTRRRRTLSAQAVKQ